VMEQPKCDQCDKPATMLCIDVLRHECPGDAWVTYSPLPGVKCGCDDHPVRSVEHVTHLLRRDE